MATQPITLKAIRRPQAPGLSELSALALIWGVARAISETPPDTIDLLLDELTDDSQSPTTKDSLLAMTKQIAKSKPNAQADQTQGNGHFLQKGAVRG